MWNLDYCIVLDSIANYELLLKFKENENLSLNVHKMKILTIISLSAHSYWL